MPAMGTEDLLVVTFDKDHKPSGKAAADDDSLATAQALVNTTSASLLTPHIREQHTVSYMIL